MLLICRKHCPLEIGITETLQIRVYLVVPVSFSTSLYLADVDLHELFTKLLCRIFAALPWLNPQTITIHQRRSRGNKPATMTCRFTKQVGFIGIFQYMTQYNLTWPEKKKVQKVSQHIIQTWVYHIYHTCVLYVLQTCVINYSASC